MLFFINSTFISNARLKLSRAKNQANGKQHPEAELLLFENYSHSSSTLITKNNRIYSKNQTKDYAIYHNENENETDKYNKQIRHK